VKKKVRQKLEKEKRRVERWQRQPASATRLGSLEVRYDLIGRTQAVAQGGFGCRAQPRATSGVGARDRCTGSRATGHTGLQ